MYYPCFPRNIFQVKRQYSVLICMQLIFQVSISMQHTNEFVTLCAGKYHVQSGGAGRQRWDTSAQRTCCSALLTVLAAKTHASSFPLAISAVPFFPDLGLLTHKKVGINVSWINEKKKKKFKKVPVSCFLKQTFSRNRQSKLDYKRRSHINTVPSK